MQADIIIPVWNKPLETRNCLASLVTYTPDCRLIMVDNGSDRETRVILQEMADFLNERALLLCRKRNDGFIGSVNAGLERADAPWIGVVKSTAVVSAGWLAPLDQAALQRPDAGILIPRLVAKGEKRGKRSSVNLPVEAEPERFEAIFFRKDFIKPSGLVDADLGEGHWSLGDLSRRAHKNGYVSLLVPDSIVEYVEEPVFGSPAYREAREARSRQIFDTRWGERRSYCIYFPKEVDVTEIGRKLDTLLLGARQGDRFTVIVHNRHYRKLVESGRVSLHVAIAIVPLPRFSLSHAAVKVWRRVQEQDPHVQPVSGVEGTGFPGGESALSFSGLAIEIDRREIEIYGRNPDAE